MSVPDPTFLVAAIIFLDLTRKGIERKLVDDPSAGFAVEWLAWGIIVMRHWAQPYVRSWTASFRSASKLEGAVVEIDQTLTRSYAGSIAALSFCLVAAGYNNQSAHGRYNWTLPLIPTSLLGFMFINHMIELNKSEGRQLAFGAHGSLSTSLLTGAASQIPSALSVVLFVYSDLEAPSAISAQGLCFFALQCSIYYALSRFEISISSQSVSASAEQKYLLQRLSLQSFGLWTLLLLVFRAWHWGIQLWALPAAVLQASRYFLLVTLCLRYSQSAVVAATTLPTVVVAVEKTLQATSPTSSIIGSLVAFLALIQTIWSLPRSATYRNILILLWALPSITTIHQHTSLLSWQPRMFQGTAPPSLHPIEQLAASSHARFLELLRSQSNTLKQAVAEYRRRYKRDPPPNFDKWFEIAQTEGYVFPDEFDTMMESLDPFWKVPVSELKIKLSSAFEDPHLIRFNVSSGLLSYDHEGRAPWMADMIDQWLPPEWTALLPNMTFAVNILDEPRVIAPLNHFEQLPTSSGKKKVLQNAHNNLTGEQYDSVPVDFVSVDRQQAWEEMKAACATDSPARGAWNTKAEALQPRFLSNTTNSLDICLHPDLHQIHGFLFSPESVEITGSLLPIFSQGKPSMFRDVLYPSPYYAGKIDQHDYHREEDPAWSQKSDTLYWAGAATGGHATMTNWQKLHRQRLILWLNSRTTSTVKLLNESVAGHWIPYNSFMSDLSSHFDVKITGIAQCEFEACKAQKAAFGSVSSDGEEKLPAEDPLNATYQARYNLDMDGNAFSGRYYRLLKSGSAVIKQTIFREWHDDRLVPWVHYIPLSMEAAELPEMMRFLIQDPRGRELGKRIGGESRSWTNIALRKMDLQLAFFRLLMEYGRLMSDYRDHVDA